jgi:hypothetical protein
MTLSGSYSSHGCPDSAFLMSYSSTASDGDSSARQFDLDTMKDRIIQPKPNLYSGDRDADLIE